MFSSQLKMLLMLLRLQWLRTLNLLFVQTQLFVLQFCVEDELVKEGVGPLTVSSLSEVSNINSLFTEHEHELTIC